MPEQISAEVGVLSVNNQEVPAIVQNMVTPSGVVQAILPLEAVDKLIEILVNVREAAKSNTGIYVPKSPEEVEAIARAQNEVRKSE